MTTTTSGDELAQLLSVATTGDKRARFDFYRLLLSNIRLRPGQARARLEPIREPLPVAA